jgi:hypothetical protein
LGILVATLTRHNAEHENEVASPSEIVTMSGVGRLIGGGAVGLSFLLGFGQHRGGPGPRRTPTNRREVRKSLLNFILATGGRARVNCRKRSRQAKRRAGPIGVMLARCEREPTAQPTSGYQTGAPALLRAAQDAVKEGKGRDRAKLGPRPRSDLASTPR